MAPTLDAVLLERWAQAAAAALDRHHAAIDRINVFPVADRDTGTNLLLTMRAAVAAVREAQARTPAPVGAPRGDRSPQVRSAVDTAEALARGALLHARGNSGVILSQVLRGIAEAVAVAGARAGGAVLADGLARGAHLAAGAVSPPREGTVLTVLDAAATAARDVAAQDGAAQDVAGESAPGRDRLDAVAVAASTAAAGALRATTGQLAELSRAGVVDAGGLGLCVVLDALAALVTGHVGGDLPALLAGAGEDAGDVRPAAPATAGSPAPTEPRYEVMYLLDGADEAAVAALRATLQGLGDAVAVVGAGPGGDSLRPGGADVSTVHVHCADIGAALEAGMTAGRLHRVRVVPLVDRPDGGPGPDGFTRDRAVVVVVGPDLGALARAAGADVLIRPEHGAGGDPEGPDVDETALAGSLAATGARHVVLLPCDGALAGVADRAAGAARRAGREVVVVPAASAVAGLAALAVHDPARHAADDVVAMTEAAAGTRTGVLEIARSEALTWAGRCGPGDVLGLVDGEVVLIAPDIPVGALWLASRMLTAGGELVTVLLGPGVADAVGEGLVAQLRRSHPAVDVVVHRGGRAGRPVELGVE